MLLKDKLLLEREKIQYAEVMDGHNIDKSNDLAGDGSENTISNKSPARYPAYAVTSWEENYSEEMVKPSEEKSITARKIENTELFIKDLSLSTKDVGPFETMENYVLNVEELEKNDIADSENESAMEESGQAFATENSCSDSRGKEKKQDGSFNLEETSLPSEIHIADFDDIKDYGTEDMMNTEKETRATEDPPRDQNQEHEQKDSIQAKN